MPKHDLFQAQMEASQWEPHQYGGVTLSLATHPLYLNLGGMSFSVHVLSGKERKSQAVFMFGSKLLAFKWVFLVKC